MRAFLLIALFASASAQQQTEHDPIRQYRYYSPLVGSNQQHAQEIQQHVQQHLVQEQQHSAQGQQHSAQGQQHSVQGQQNLVHGQQHAAQHQTHEQQLLSNSINVNEPVKPVQQEQEQQDLKSAQQEHVHQAQQQQTRQGELHTHQNEQHPHQSAQHTHQGQQNTHQGQQHVDQNVPQHHEHHADANKSNVFKYNITSVVKHVKVPHENFTIPARVQHIVDQVHKHIPQVVKHHLAQKNNQSKTGVVVVDEKEVTPVVFELGKVPTHTPLLQNQRHLKQEKRGVEEVNKSQTNVAVGNANHKHPHNVHSVVGAVIVKPQPQPGVTDAALSAQEELNIQQVRNFLPQLLSYLSNQAQQLQRIISSFQQTQVVKPIEPVDAAPVKTENAVDNVPKESPQVNIDQEEGEQKRAVTEAIVNKPVTPNQLVPLVTNHGQGVVIPPKVQEIVKQVHGHIPQVINQAQHQHQQQQHAHHSGVGQKVDGVVVPPKVQSIEGVVVPANVQEIVDKVHQHIPQVINQAQQHKEQQAQQHSQHGDGHSQHGNGHSPHGVGHQVGGVVVPPQVQGVQSVVVPPNAQQVVDKVHQHIPQVINQAQQHQQQSHHYTQHGGVGQQAVEGGVVPPKVPSVEDGVVVPSQVQGVHGVVVPPNAQQVIDKVHQHIPQVINQAQQQQ